MERRTNRSEATDASGETRRALLPRRDRGAGRRALLAAFAALSMGGAGVVAAGAGEAADATTGATADAATGATADASAATPVGGRSPAAWYSDLRWRRKPVLAFVAHRQRADGSYGSAEAAADRVVPTAVVLYALAGGDWRMTEKDHPAVGGAAEFLRGAAERIVARASPAFDPAAPAAAAALACLRAPGDDALVAELKRRVDPAVIAPEDVDPDNPGALFAGGFPKTPPKGSWQELCAKTATALALWPKSLRRAEGFALPPTETFLRFAQWYADGQDLKNELDAAHYGSCAPRVDDPRNPESDPVVASALGMMTGEMLLSNWKRITAK